MVVKYLMKEIKQGWETYGPRAACGPLEHFVRPANTFKTSVNLSYDDKSGKHCRVYEPKALHAIMKRAFVGLHRSIFRLITG